MRYHAFDLQFSKAMLALERQSMPDSLRPSSSESQQIGSLLLRFLSYQIRSGHVCLDFRRLSAWTWEEGDASWPFDAQGAELSQEESKARAQKEQELLLSQKCQAWLRRSTLVTQEPKKEMRPLVLYKERLYLYRYYHYEVEVLEYIKQSLGAAPESIYAQVEYQKKCQTLLEAFFPQNSRGLGRPQRLAAMLSILRNFLIISGGPGTGKSTCIANILRLHLALHKARGAKEELRIAVAAPTGKAVMRLQEILQKKESEWGQDGLPAPSILDTIQMATIHRLLGYSSSLRRPMFYYHKDRPLSIDLLLIDEASMLNLSLLAHCLRALPSHAKLILVGDHQQLASVEAGSVFSSLCASMQAEALPSSLSGLHDYFGQSASRRSALDHHIVQFKQNYRIQAQAGQKSAVMLLCQCIQEGRIEEALECIRDHKSYPDLCYYETSAFAAPAFPELVREHFRHYQDAELHSILESLNRFCVLSSLREGPEGTQALNRYIRQILLQAGILSAKEGQALPCPILVMENDYDKQLFNGDMGLLFAAAEQKVAVFFKQKDSIGSFPLDALPAYEPGFALTVHKSQGSEFEHVVLAMPEEKGPLLSRELIYTALSRARRKITIFASIDILQRALERVTVRSSALGEQEL